MSTKTKHIGKQTVALEAPPSVVSSACVGGKKEGEGPLRACFDRIDQDSYFGQKTWEAAESVMLRDALERACAKAGLQSDALDYIFAGDLLNQCASSTFALRGVSAPFFGLYGACSTMAESLSLAAMMIDGGYAARCAALTSSHFCGAERQFRLPLEYGGQRPPTAQWTVTGAGALILQAVGPGPYVTHVTTGRIVDAGISDVNNMGACMAPAAADTICAHLRETGRRCEDYDAILTGDLGSEGHAILLELLQQEGYAPGGRCMDCGMLVFDPATQDVHAGGSGCGCSAVVLAGHALRQMAAGAWKRVLFAATGALMSPTTSLQGESVPGICHAVALDKMGRV